MAQYGIAAVFNSHTSGGVFQSSMRLSKFSLRLNAKLLIVNGKLCPRWDWGILSRKGVRCAMRPPKNGRGAHRRNTDVIPT